MYRLRVMVICLAMAAGSKIVLSADKGDAKKGKEIFDQCAVCHNADSEDKKVGPGLKGLFKKEKMGNGKKPTEANVRERVNEGAPGMPPYKDMLSDQERDDLIAYLKTL